MNHAAECNQETWEPPKVLVRWTETADTALGLPSYESMGAAGADLKANFPDRQTLSLSPGGRALIPTGLRMALPEGYEAQVRPRSGLALRHGITLLNAPGTIDSDYRGEVSVILINLGTETFDVTHGMRVAQMVLASVVQVVFESAETLSETKRGTGGFGSTGVGP